MDRAGPPTATEAGWEHFPHDADIGVRGFGTTAAEAFEQAARALTAIVTLAEVAPKVRVEVRCEAPDIELLLAEWLNAIIYEMAVRQMLFGKFAVRIEDGRLEGTLWGEAVDVERHAPACEPKGATYTALKVVADANGVLVSGLRRRCLVEVAMDPGRFAQVDATTWRIEPYGAMHVPAIIYADEDLIRGMDDKVYEQAANVAALPGIVQACYVMPDAHWGYGFPIGGVAAFDPDQGGVVSAGGVGFDISCGVRTMLTGLKVADISPVQRLLADRCFAKFQPASAARARLLDCVEMDAMLAGRGPLGGRARLGRGAGPRTNRGSRPDGGRRARRAFPSAQRNASATKWARSVRATTISKFRRSRRFSTRILPKLSAWRGTMWSSASIAARAGSATRSEPTS